MAVQTFLIKQTALSGPIKARPKHEFIRYHSQRPAKQSDHLSFPQNLTSRNLVALANTEHPFPCDITAR